MANEFTAARHNAGLQAAIRRFPEEAHKIEQMAVGNQDFCYLCVDLLDAEAALSAIDAAPPALREARRLEWQGCIDRLTKEIEQALQNTNVIPLMRVNQSRRR
jgi:hypothetical protein